ncbi:MAG: Stp1/IreP family PP2C-type Ser/Thr phosphatase [Actinomycetia bacterium]|nr:Stp1/IreP family PP2C-type Ser/Thr phosphatase [Actinomycetes bacterium]
MSPRVSSLRLTASGRRQRSHYPFSAQTNIGRQRTINEDSILALPPLFAVADGLGGHEAGEVASALAIDTLRDHAPRAVDTPALVRAVQAANNAIIKGIEAGIGHDGMGCTMTALMVEAGKASIAQVGDSRAYLLRGRQLTQITEDHSVVAAMLRSGHITSEEARVHPQRSVITRALGSDPELIVDRFEIDVLRGDRLLICSDGLTSMVDDEHITTILNARSDPHQAALDLIAAANKAGGTDNISVIVIDIDEDQPQSRTHRRSRLWLWILIWIVLVAGLIAAVAFGVSRYTRSAAYLDVGRNGLVTVNQGVPGSILGFSLTYASEESTITVADLTAADQSAVRARPTYPSLDKARRDLESMARRAKSFSGQDPGTPGMPESTP